MAFDLDSLTVQGPPVPVLSGVETKSTGAASFSVSPDGTLVYVTGSDAAPREGQLLVVDLEGNEDPFDFAPRNFDPVRWSPDGQSVVYSSDDQICTHNVTLGTTPRQLTFEGQNRGPVFSPDGTRVAFASNRDGTVGRDLFVKNLDDDSPPRSIITLDGSQTPSQWPSDTVVVFQSVEGGNSDLWLLNLSDPDTPTAAAYLSSEAWLWGMRVSPDGTLAAYASRESGQNEVYLCGFPDPGERTRVSQGVALGALGARWSPDGSSVYYLSREREDVYTVMAAQIRSDSQPPVVLSRNSLFTKSSAPSAGVPSDLHPDGNRFIWVQNVGTVDADDTAEPAQLNIVQNWHEELKRLVPID